MDRRNFLKISITGIAGTILLPYIPKETTKNFKIPASSPFESIEFTKRIDDYDSVMGIGIKVKYKGKMYRHTVLWQNPDMNDKNKIEFLKKKLYLHLVDFVKFSRSTKCCRYGYFKGNRVYKTIHNEFIVA